MARRSAAHRVFVCLRCGQRTVYDGIHDVVCETPGCTDEFFRECREAALQHELRRQERQEAQEALFLATLKAWIPTRTH